MNVPNQEELIAAQYAPYRTPDFPLQLSLLGTNAEKAVRKNRIENYPALIPRVTVEALAAEVARIRRLQDGEDVVIIGQDVGFAEAPPLEENLDVIQRFRRYGCFIETTNGGKGGG
jgi:hypothetical protein